MTDIYFRLTDRCNLTCAHCCGSYGPDGISISQDVLDKTITSLMEPSPTGGHELVSIAFSGGEPMTEPALLERALKNITEHPSGYKPFLTLQTNGFWAEDKDSAYEVLKMLTHHGLCTIDVSGDDRYHESQCRTRGYVTSKQAFENITDAANSLPEQERTWFGATIRGAPDSLLPFGRAKRLKKKLMKTTQCKRSYNQLFVEPDGSVQLCPYQGLTRIGSLPEQPLRDIIYQTILANQSMDVLVLEGLEGLARFRGNLSEQDMKTVEKNPCSVCHDILPDLL